MEQNGFVTYDEIWTQTAAWMEAVGVVGEHSRQLTALDLQSYRQVLFAGCGSTYYLALSAASLFQSLTGVPTRALPSSEYLFYPKSAFCAGKLLLVAISRSGTTSETISAVEKFKKAYGGDVIVITNAGGSPLARLGDIVLSIESGREASVAQTRSFTSMYVAATAMSTLMGTGKDFGPYADALQNAGNRLMESHRALAQELGGDRSIRQVFFLGSGPRYGLGCEACLKLKELSQTVTEPFHFFEFRHGPISMVNDRSLVIGMLSQSAYDREMDVIRDVRKLSGKAITIGEKDADIQFGSGLPESAQGVLYLPVMQLFAYYRAVESGKDPDKPRNLTAVVELSLDPA